jgi:hypothetical protein
MTAQNPAWCDLPNARYINWVIDSLTLYPELWRQVSRLQSKNIPSTPEANVSTRRRYLAMEAAWLDAVVVAPAGTETAVEATMRALVVYDDHGALIEADLREVGLLAGLGVGPAQMLLAACGVHSRIRGLGPLAG